MIRIKWNSRRVYAQHTLINCSFVYPDSDFFIHFLLKILEYFVGFVLIAGFVWTFFSLFLFVHSLYVSPALAQSSFHWTPLPFDFMCFSHCSLWLAPEMPVESHTNTSANRLVSVVHLVYSAHVSGARWGRISINKYYFKNTGDFFENTRESVSTQSFCLLLDALLISSAYDLSFWPNRFSARSTLMGSVGLLLYKDSHQQKGIVRRLRYCMHWMHPKNVVDIVWRDYIRKVFYFKYRALWQEIFFIILHIALSLVSFHKFYCLCLHRKLIQVELQLICTKNDFRIQKSYHLRSKSLWLIHTNHLIAFRRHENNLGDLVRLNRNWF